MSNVRTLFRRAAVLLAVLAALAVCTLAADYTADTPEAFYDVLEQSLRAQDDLFSIAYTGNRAALERENHGELGPTLRAMSAQSEDGPDNADYPALNIADGQMGWLENAYYFEISYLAAQDQIDEVSRRAAEIVGSFDLAEEDDYTKVKLLYEYICTHYTYDETLTKFSAYDGLTTGSMVCQGYALLTYKVMWNAGIPCRIVTGVSSGQNHAWNIVKLDGKWYNLDTTWDAAAEIGGVMRWDYFLKNTEDFAGHFRFEPYETAKYHKAHPMADESLELPRVTMTVNGGEVVNLIVRAGVEVQLEAVLPEGMDSEVQWSSTNPDAISVKADGRLIANGLGETVITAVVTGNRGVISAQVPTQAVDLRTASPWAYETVTEYYLAQMLPYTLCSDFQTGITRAELARLCYQYILQQQGWGSMLLNNPYEDITESPDALAILCVRSIGLMEGTSETTFSPNAVVTREQAAKVLVRLMEFLDDAIYQGTGTEDYADADQVSQWAAPYVAAATEAGVLEGSGAQFRPQSPMTREQMVLALYRVYAARADRQTAEAA